MSNDDIGEVELHRFLQKQSSSGGPSPPVVTRRSLPRGSHSRRSSQSPVTSRHPSIVGRQSHSPATSRHPSIVGRQSHSPATSRHPSYHQDGGSRQLTQRSSHGPGSRQLTQRSSHGGHSRNASFFERMPTMQGIQAALHADESEEEGQSSEDGEYENGELTPAPRNGRRLLSKRRSHASHWSSDDELEETNGVEDYVLQAFIERHQTLRSGGRMIRNEGGRRGHRRFVSQVSSASTAASDGMRVSTFSKLETNNSCKPPSPRHATLPSSMNMPPVGSLSGYVTPPLHENAELEEEDEEEDREKEQSIHVVEAKELEEEEEEDEAEAEEAEEEGNGQDDEESDIEYDEEEEEVEREENPDLWINPYAAGIDKKKNALLRELRSPTSAITIVARTANQTLTRRKSLFQALVESSTASLKRTFFAAHGTYQSDASDAHKRLLDALRNLTYTMWLGGPSIQAECADVIPLLTRAFLSSSRGDRAFTVHPVVYEAVFRFVAELVRSHRENQRRCTVWLRILGRFLANHSDSVAYEATHTLFLLLHNSAVNQTYVLDHMASLESLLATQPSENLDPLFETNYAREVMRLFSWVLPTPGVSASSNMIAAAKSPGADVFSPSLDAATHQRAASTS